MLLEKIWGLIRILRPEISIFGMLCVYIGAIASGSDLINYDIIIKFRTNYLLRFEVPCL